MDTLKNILARIENWPVAAQEQLAEMILVIDASVRGGDYNVSAEELRAIDEADRSGVASDEEVAAAFWSFRPSS